MRVPSARERLAGAVWAAGMSTLLLWAFLQPAVEVPRRLEGRAHAAATLVYARPVANPADQVRPMPRNSLVRPTPAATTLTPNAAALQAPGPVGPAAPAATVPVPHSPSTAQTTGAGEAHAHSALVVAASAASAAAAAVVAPAPLRAASAPLRLDAAVIREASRTSRSPVQQMAEASGRPTGDEPAGARQKLADGVAKTVKPECFQAGGTAGLLSPLYSAYLIATDQCRTR